MIDPEDLIIPPQQIAKLKTQAQSETTSHKSQNKAQQKILFYLIPTELSEALLKMNYAPVWGVLLTIYEAWYRSFEKRTPVKLTSTLWKNLGLSREQKTRALKLLEQSDLFIVERRPGRCPLITIKWIWSFGPFKKGRSKGE